MRCVSCHRPARPWRTRDRRRARTRRLPGRHARRSLFLLRTAGARSEPPRFHDVSDDVAGLFPALRCTGVAGGTCGDSRRHPDRRVRTCAAERAGTFRLLPRRRRPGRIFRRPRFLATPGTSAVQGIRLQGSGEPAGRQYPQEHRTSRHLLLPARLQGSGSDLRHDRPGNRTITACGRRAIPFAWNGKERLGVSKRNCPAGCPRPPRDQRMPER